MKSKFFALLAASLLLSTGCSALKQKLTMLPDFKLPSLTKESQSSSEDQTTTTTESIQYGKPVKMLAIWKGSVKTDTGKQAMRGFGGRVYLYDADGNPIRAKGQLVVYGYDDSVKERVGSKADKKEVFDNEAFQTLYSESALGHSYSVWLDWDEVGSPSKNVTLVPFFVPADGEIVPGGRAIYSLQNASDRKKLHKELMISSSSKHGASADQPSVAQAGFVDNAQGNAARTADYQETGRAGNADSQSSKMQTTTIQLPLATRKRMGQAAIFQSTAKQHGEGIGTGSTSSADTAKAEQPSWLDAARAKRQKELEESRGRVFGLPGQL